MKINPFRLDNFEAPELNIQATVELQLDGFLKQNVLCYRGDWVSRTEVIKYVANVASGIHSGRAKEREELILARIRSSSSFSVRDGGIHLELFSHGIDVDETTFKHAPDGIDPVLVELLAAATFLADSPFVGNLEAAIHAELS